LSVQRCLAIGRLTGFIDSIQSISMLSNKRD
jgi:hypothetical protein